MIQKTETPIEIFVDALELEHHDNSEAFSRHEKIQAAINRKIQNGVFDDMFPKDLLRSAIIIDEADLVEKVIGYNVKARIITSKENNETAL